MMTRKRFVNFEIVIIFCRHCFALHLHLHRDHVHEFSNYLYLHLYPYL